MSDELESLTDGQLSEVFAVEFAGFTRIETTQCGVVWKDAEGAVAQLRHIHRFATSADAVLPFLQKAPAPSLSFAPALGTWCVSITVISGRYTREFLGYDTTLARAACIALIRAARAQKGQA